MKKLSIGILGAGGRMGVYTSHATHIVIDVTGYMTA